MGRNRIHEINCCRTRRNMATWVLISVLTNLAFVCARSAHSASHHFEAFNPNKEVKYMYLTGQKVSASSFLDSGFRLIHATDGSASTMFHTAFREGASWFKISLPDSVADKNVIGFQIQNRRWETYCGSIGLEGSLNDVDFMFTGACAGPVTGKTLKLVGPSGIKNPYTK